ncbi:MAG TPA: hypothetical protein PL033_13540 [Candidatus Brocadiia bacterium]|nr:hypothetical protein [Candidatus Brocadiia bacterium]
MTEIRPDGERKIAGGSTAGLRVLIGFLCVCAVCPAQQKDTVTVKRDDKGGLEQKKGVIVSEGYKEIVLKTGEKEGEVERIPLGDVTLVQYGAQSINLNNAPGDIQQGDYDRAVKRLEAARAEELPEGLKLRALMMEARMKLFLSQCFESSSPEGKAEVDAFRKDAAAFYGKVIETAPGFRFAPEAHVGLLSALILSGRTDEAAAAANAIKAKTDYPPREAMRAEAWTARLAAVSRKAHVEAVKQLDGVISRAMKAEPAMAEVADEARFLKGMCLWELKDYRAAEEEFERVGIFAQEEEMKALGMTARGECLMERGEMREALFSFLRVEVLHFRVKPLHAKSLYMSARCAESEKVQLPERAAEMRKTLATRYAESPWARLLKTQQQSPAP